MRSVRKKSCIALGLLLTLILFSNFTSEKTISAISSENAQALQITTTDGENITLAIIGNVSISQITDFFFMNLPDWYNNTNVDFNLIELNGSTAFVNMTIPKNAILGGTVPVVSVNGGLPRNNGFTKDNGNFYVWFTAQPQWDNNNQSHVGIGFLLETNREAISSSHQTFIMPATATQTVNVMLRQGETLSGNVHLSDSLGEEFNFKVVDPNGHSIVQYEHVNSKMWQFIAQKNGTYTLALNNPSGFSTIESVTLDYSVLINVPANNCFASLSLFVVLGILVAVGIALVIFWTERSKPKTSPKVSYS